MASFDDIIAALKGGKLQPDAMPFGVGGPAEPVHEATNIINPLAGSLAQKTMDVPKHLIDQAAQFDPNDIHGSTARAVPVAADTTLALMRGSGLAPTVGNELRMGIKAFHASPHNFDTFSLVNKGAGEGKADFGHGIYASENPAVNKYYHDQFGPEAKTYHLDINAEPHQLLDLDRPIGQEHLKKIMSGHPEDEALSHLINYSHKTGITGSDFTGQHVYNALAQGMGHGPASEYLNSVGIPGAKYLDAGSRMKGEGTSNYVMYDPNLINILKKEGASPVIPQPSGPLSSGDAFRKNVLQARDDYYHKDVMGALGDYWRNIQKNMTPEDIRIANNYTTPAYRGLNAGWNSNQEFNPVYQKHSEGSTMYSTASPELADMYAGKIDPKWETAEGSGYTHAPGAAIQPLYLDTSKYHTIDAGGAKWAGKPQLEMNQIREDKSVPGAIINNVHDTPMLEKFRPGPTTVYATFPQGAPTAKSKFASKFDPLDPNMLHGAGLGVAPAAGMLDALRDKKEKK